MYVNNDPKACAAFRYKEVNNQDRARVRTLMFTKVVKSEQKDQDERYRKTSNRIVTCAINRKWQRLHKRKHYVDERKCDHRCYRRESALAVLRDNNVAAARTTFKAVQLIVAERQLKRRTSRCRGRARYQNHSKQGDVLLLHALIVSPLQCADDMTTFNDSSNQLPTPRVQRIRG